jgi:hypothetical protein
MELPIYKLFVKPILYFSQFFDECNFVIVCKGYNDDFELSTGIYWQDDKENCLDYSDYKVWLNFNYKN